ncbi:DUF6232 family protein [Undibacterium sp. Tian12W]|uniref:DUF6232 family protein n=1 Tax=Undibacterium sp. Tian12W TaxID=3413054 RepID=UPI003BF2715D
MFCSKCGSEVQADAKFCNSCGASLNVDVPPAPQRNNDVVVEKVFMDRHGVYVSDVMFRLSTGANFPIRNLTSVTVSQKSGNVLLFILALFSTLFSLIMVFNVPFVGFVMLALSAVFFILYFQRDWQLKVGAGGIIQVAIQDKNKAYLDSVATAINESLAYMERK